MIARARLAGRGLAAAVLVAVSLPALPAPAADAAAPVTARRPLAEIVDDYVREGLRANLALRRGRFDVERAIAALDEARASFLPGLSLDARYTRSEGGREFLLPLSQLNPALEDETVAFLRPREQDSRLTLLQPLYAPAIPATVRAQRAQLAASEYAQLALARRLKRDIVVGYLDWLRATRTVAIIESSRVLLAENLRVNESLHRNGKITEDQVLRARAELLAVVQQRREGENLARQAASYLNFLLDRPLDASLEPATVEDIAVRPLADPAALEAGALERRPELAQAASAARAAEAQVDVAQAARRPTLAFSLDGGIQGEEYGSGRGYNYGQATLRVTWKLFDGGAGRAAVRGAQALVRRAAAARDELAQQVRLEVQQALDRLETARDSLATAEARALAARAGFRIASRKRDEGVISQVEFIDARSALTGAELNLNVTRFALLAREADLDYVTAAGTLPADPVTTGLTP